MKLNYKSLTAVLIILSTFTLFSCNKNANNSTGKSKSKTKDSYLTIVLEKETQLYELDPTYQKESLDIIQTLPSNTKVTLIPDTVYYLYNSSEYVIQVNYKNDITGNIFISDLNIQPEIIEKFMNQVDPKNITKEEEDFLDDIFYILRGKPIQDYSSHLIEYFYTVYNTKIDGQEHQWFIHLIFNLWKFVEPDSKTNPLSYLIKYGNENVFTIFLTGDNYYLPSYDSDYNNYNIADFPSDENKYTPAIQAVICENPAALAYFLKKDINLNYKTPEGKTLSDYINESKNKEIKELYTIYNPCLDFYDNLLEKLTQQGYEEMSEKLYYNIPVSFYYRNNLLSEPIQAESYEDFINELEIQEEIQNIEKLDEEAFSQRKQNTFPFEAYVTTDDGSKLRVRSEPSTESSEVISIPQNTKLTILDISQNYDQIDNIIDYWYKISWENKEGWCFGGFLSSRITTLSSNSLEEARIYPQQQLSEKKIYAIKNTKIHFLNESTLDIKPGDEVEILEIADSKYQKYTDAIYGFYLAKFKNKYGIICGNAFANERLFYDENGGKSTFYVQIIKISEYSCEPFIYKQSTKLGKCEKLEFQDYEFDFEPDTLYASLYSDDYRGYDCPVSIGWVEEVTFNAKKYELVYFDFYINDYENNQIIFCTIPQDSFTAVENFRMTNSIYHNYEYNTFSDEYIYYIDNGDEEPYILILLYGKQKNYEYYDESDDEFFTWSYEYHYSKTDLDPYEYKKTDEIFSHELPEI